MISCSGDINEYISSLINSPQFQEKVVFHKILPGKPVITSNINFPNTNEVKHILNKIGIKSLYSHQAEAVKLIRAGKNVVVSTPTASGKTLIYSIPVFEKLLSKDKAKALYLFPLKALSQDQLRFFEEMASFCKVKSLTACIYDGDTTDWNRKKIRQKPPDVIITNPEMLHLSFLAYNHLWIDFLSNLEIVVIDEVHTYRGLLGSHMAQVFRRFKRICAHYGAFPTFVFSSATIANPAELSSQLTDLEVKTVSKGGAFQGKKHIVFINPDQSPAQAAILLLKAALHRGLRTIVYTQSRKMTELIALWAGSKSGPYASRISAYRSGFLPEERREIEAKLTSGELLAVVSTNALELGIDIGDLDLCILVGYPGSIMATWQRSGRVGRCGQDSALILIAGEDALDQYFMRNPMDLIEMEPEAAVINPYNPEILARHLVCAASELPLKSDEPFMADKNVLKMCKMLEEQNILIRSADGTTIFARYNRPHINVDLRGAGARFKIICSQTEKNRGDIDEFRAFRETHLGAIYIHNGETYIVNDFDLENKIIKVLKSSVDYYTRVRANKDTEILEVFEEKKNLGTIIYRGHLKVTDRVTGYEKWSMQDKKKIKTIPLDLPPQIFETEGLWFIISPEIMKETESRYLHFMGGIHAIEHAAIGIFPLLVMTDRNDLGGISTPNHFQLKNSAVFIYDGVPGGAGLTRQAYNKAQELFSLTLKAISACICETGCPACVHSPRCGSGNRPIDKSAAIFILEQIIQSTSKIKSVKIENKAKKFLPLAPNKQQNIHYGVFDLETQKSAEEVGGWHRADLMKISCVVLYDSKEDKFYEFLENQIDKLINHFNKLDLIVGFNIKKFDYSVLKGYSNFNFFKLPTLDILENIKDKLGYRLSLDNIGTTTLGFKKSANGLIALKWWKEGKIKDIMEYCKMDVAITRDIYKYGKDNGYLLYTNKLKQQVRVLIDF